MRNVVTAGTAIVVALGVVNPSETLAQAGGCKNNPNALGISRTVEIDTTGGPGFGFEHYKAHDFLQSKEVVLTFDDGPWPTSKPVLAALAAHCLKATFFIIGKHAFYHPDVLREIAAQGHTVGTHTWSHANVRKAGAEKGKEEIELGISAVRRVVGGPIAPFFRYPFLLDSPETVAHLASRNVAMFSTDIDSFDFKIRVPDQLVKSLMGKLEKKDKGIVLMHDVQAGTSKGLPDLLNELKAKGYKIVHMKAKGELRSLAQYDTLVMEQKEAKSFAPTAAGSDRPTSSVVKTVPATPEPAPAPPGGTGQKR